MGHVIQANPARIRDLESRWPLRALRSDHRH